MTSECARHGSTSAAARAHHSCERLRAAGYPRTRGAQHRRRGQEKAQGQEENKEDRAIEFYTVLSKMDLVSSTPTLFNSGTIHSQMSSCYINISDDSLQGILLADIGILPVSDSGALIPP